MEVFTSNDRILRNRSYFDSLLKRICIIISKGDDIGEEWNNHFSLCKIVKETNHMVFQEVLFARFSLKEDIAFGLDQNAINSRNK